MTHASVREEFQSRSRNNSLTARCRRRKTLYNSRYSPSDLNEAIGRFKTGVIKAERAVLSTVQKKVQSSIVAYVQHDLVHQRRKGSSRLHRYKCIAYYYIYIRSSSTVWEGKNHLFGLDGASLHFLRAPYIAISLMDCCSGGGGGEIFLFAVGIFF